jgi:hypothetical protein
MKKKSPLGSQGAFCKMLAFLRGVGYTLFIIFL